MIVKQKLRVIPKMIIKIILMCLLLSGCATYKNNKLHKEILSKQQAWLNI